MRVRTFLLVTLLFVGAIAFQAQPAQAEFPEKYSMVMLDYFGFLIDCLDVGRCNATTCNAGLYLSGRSGHCTPIEFFEPAKARTTCTFTNFNFSFFAPNTKQVELDLTCSRWGTPWFWEGISQPTGTCAVMATQRRIDRFGANFTKNESYVAATIDRPAKCSSIFSTMSEEEIRDFDPRRLVNFQPR